ncbi:hypothetical protein J2S78_000313 [Salibacterium salarium]|uniref:YcdB/YcdC domain-containing protein n=1 Tax=Salibacterium salarium TaxID=284579 RepID=UPI00277DC52E|nr:YcdB/YcdC domain-containing protein [Salibacterium salarium]MDQ0297905.1 hypothetical protein [Salibacterium salarium]
MNSRRIGIVSLSTALAISFSASDVSAEEAVTEQAETGEKQVVEISAADVNFTKEDLIDRFYELFPSGFDFLEESDFHMNHFRGVGSDDDIIQHHLSFQKETADGEPVRGSVQFVGEELELQYFDYQPKNVQDALYPADVTQEEAEASAKEFIENTASGEYELSDQQRPNVSVGNQTLTEPVEYDLYFQRMENDIPVQNQNIQVTVLGNGEISSYRNTTYQEESASYEEPEDVVEKEEAKASIADSLDLRLQYNVQHDFESDEENVSLVYAPSPGFQGIQAKTGDWDVNNSFVSELPEENEIKRLREEPVETEADPVSREDAEEMAKDLITVSDDAELNIESIEETERNGTEVFSVQFMIHRGNSGTGTSFDIEKDTGDIVQFRNIDYDQQSQEVNLSEEEALKAAVEAAETYGGSSIHEYAYPINGGIANLNNRGVYNFSFPQVKNGLPVQGRALNIGISAEDGELVSFSNMRQGEIENWPEPESAVDKEKALEDYKNDLDVDLSYVSHDQSGDTTDTYHLVYQPAYHANGLYYDAADGDWVEPQSSDSSAEEVITDHWAADEINYMVQSGILSVDEGEELKPNEAVSKGTALEMLMKSMESFYPSNPTEDQTATFENIQSDHPSFQVVERAVRSGIIDAEEDTFPVNDTLTREELAVWIVRSMELEEAAKHADIYGLPFEDADDITEEHAGYVGLAYAKDILQGSDNHFNPDDEVTLAHLAVTCFRLAEKQAN